MIKKILKLDIYLECFRQLCIYNVQHHLNFQLNLFMLYQLLINIFIPILNNINKKKNLNFHYYFVLVIEF